MDYIFLYTESRNPSQNELNRLIQGGVTESCTTTSFSTCSVTPTKFVGALQTLSPSPLARTREAEGTEQPTPRVTPPIPMSTPPPSLAPPPPPPPPPSPSPPLVAPEEPSFVPSIRLTSETIVSIVIGVLLFIVLIILVVVLIACVCHKRTTVSLDNKAQLGSVGETKNTHMSQFHSQLGSSYGDHEWSLSWSSGATVAPLCNQIVTYLRHYPLCTVEYYPSILDNLGPQKVSSLESPRILGSCDEEVSLPRCFNFRVWNMDILLYTSLHFNGGCSTTEVVPALGANAAWTYLHWEWLNL